MSVLVINDSAYFPLPDSSENTINKRVIQWVDSKRPDVIPEKPEDSMNNMNSEQAPEEKKEKRAYQKLYKELIDEENTN